MADAANIDRERAGDEALDRVAGVAPPTDTAATGTSGSTEGLHKDDRPTTHVRDAEDAGDHTALKRDPADEDGKLEVGLDESFPTSDPPSITHPGGSDPAPSSGYDEQAEADLARQKAAAK